MVTFVKAEIIPARMYNSTNAADTNDLFATAHLSKANDWAINSGTI